MKKRTSRRPRRRSRRNADEAQAKILARVKPTHLEDFLALAEFMRTKKYGYFEAGHFARYGGDVADIADTAPLPERRTGFLLRTYPQEYAELFGHTRGAYMKGGYEKSGSGPFGRYSSSRGGYHKPAVLFYTKGR